MPKCFKHAPSIACSAASPRWPPGHAGEMTMHTQSKIDELERELLRTNLPDFRVGDTVRVHYKIVEGDKDRIQVFQGVVLKRHRAGARSTFTVRKVSFNVGVERMFLLHSPVSYTH